MMVIMMAVVYVGYMEDMGRIYVGVSRGRRGGGRDHE